jgi:hypothetical protein
MKIKLLGFFTGLLIGAIILTIAILGIKCGKYQQIAREQSAEIARLKLENDTLKNSGWYESQWTMENGD